MFENKSSFYITRGANETLSIHLQLLLWNLIDTLKVDEKVFVIDSVDYSTMLLAEEY